MSRLRLNIGTIDEGRQTISRKAKVIDHKNAKELIVDKGKIEFENVKFNYGMPGGLFEALSFTINSGEKFAPTAIYSPQIFFPPSIDIG